MSSLLNRCVAGWLVVAGIGGGLATCKPAMADAYAYAGIADNYFGVIDLTTGVFSPCGNSGLLLSGFGVGPDHAIYGGSFRGSSFYRITPTNGALTLVGTSSITFLDTGSTTQGVYAVDSNSALYAIDYQTGNATEIGPTGIPGIGSGMWSMSTNSKNLYFTKDSNLYVLNLKTGAGTLVGSAASGDFGATVWEFGQLFAGSASPLSIFTLDKHNGSSVLVSNITGSESGSIWGLAPITAKEIPTNKICVAHRI